MSSALYQKDTASRLRAQLRRKAISLYYNTKGTQMTYEEVAKKMQLPMKYIEKWINRYEKTGLHGYVGQRQSAILCIYKKNPNITLSQLRILLKKVGIILSNSELGQILKNLKHILTDPMFKSASEEQILRKLAKVTKVQTKSVIKMNQKMKLQREKEDGGERPYAQSIKSIFLDHSYVAHPELSYDEDDYSLYDNVDKLAKYKTDLMNKIATVSQNLDTMFDTQEKEEECMMSKDTKKYKISLLREQLLYLCLEMKGPKLGTAELVQNLPLMETMVNKWLEQAKCIKRFVHAKHVNKCCGKIQESIVRLVKLNPELTMEEIKNILRNVNIDLSNLKLERQLNSVKYMITGPDDFTDKEYEELSMDEDEIDYCIKVLSLKIASVSMSKQKRQKNGNDEKPAPTQLSLQSIIESCESGRNNGAKSKDLNMSAEKIDPTSQHSSLDRVQNKVVKRKSVCANSDEKPQQNENNGKIKKQTSNQMNGLNLLQAVTFDEMAKLGLIMKNDSSETENDQNTVKSRNTMELDKLHEDVSLLQYISMASNHKNHNSNVPRGQQSEQQEAVKETMYNIDLEENSISYGDAVKENTSPNCLAQKDNLFSCKPHQLNDQSLIESNVNEPGDCQLDKSVIVTENSLAYGSMQEYQDDIENCPAVPTVLDNDNEVTISFDERDNEAVSKNNCVENEVNTNMETSVNDADECQVDTPIENTLDEMEEESGIGSLILDSKAQDLSASSDESSSYKERKRKYSENEDTFESDESEFEPIDDLSFIGMDSDCDALVKEETDSDKDIMTEYIECEDNSVVIKYWIAT